MTIVKEFRICCPTSVEEYRRGQRYTTAKISKMEVQEGNGAGVEILENRPVEHPEWGAGQYTRKYFHIQKRVPGWLRPFLPKSSNAIHEESWNCYPYTHTVVTFPMFTKFKITIRTWHCDDKGEQENVHKLDQKTLKQRQVEVVDIAAARKDQALYSNESDINTFVSQKTGRGPLKEGWLERLDAGTPCMCAYKLVTIDFPYFGLRTKVENHLEAYERNLFHTATKQLFCWVDEWVDMNMDQVYEYEKATFQESTELTKLEGKLSTPSDSSLSETSTLVEEEE
eukprot:CAMPEP_0181319650 /NCGR_PEP_ID=MMETSP1101-20121128/17691_1 /TAXON_ID=46948 /ORGANISM="Rhodomonas abbreviata, Strain Caron Lab Isolate" /LENGTH=282 /DNA_ID=CAMNT_0023427277 /DNA_START=71 /DNA_END=919 /DNA_ORIENTATION=-